MAIESPPFSAPHLLLSSPLGIVGPFPSEMNSLGLVADPHVVPFEFTDEGHNFLMHVFFILYGLQNVKKAVPYRENWQ